MFALLAKAVCVAVLLVGVGAAARAHDEYRFVGTILKYDASKDRLEMSARETDENGRLRTFTVKMSVPRDVEITKVLKKVPRSALKPGVFVVVDAAGVDMVEIDAVAIEIVDLPKPATTATPAPLARTTPKQP
jgi:hypothetical protein